MIRKTLLAGIVISMITISSCDKDTVEIGKTLTNKTDLFSIETDTFDVKSQSLVVDAVLSRSEYSYLGRIKDPETGAYITGDYMTQFFTLENNIDSVFYTKDNIISKDNGEIAADSCGMILVINNYIGDSLAAMKLTAYELDKPVEEGQNYYTNFDPEEEGYLRNDGLKQNRVYSIVNLQLSDSIRSVHNSQSQYYSIWVPFKKTYKDKDGKEYNNYGTYLMRKYFEHPEYYKNSYSFIHNLCPGFYIKTTDGTGVMAEIVNTRLVVYYSVEVNDKTYHLSSEFHGTEEVLQTTHFSNNDNIIKELAAEDEWTYLKTPAGIFTEVTLPVDDIKKGHENDTISSAKITFRKMNDKSELSDKLLKDPTTLLMIEKDSLEHFFENHNLPNNTTSYLATLNSTYNSYTFSNISGLINYMYAKKQEGGGAYTTEHPNWNKVVLIPVKTTTTSTSSYYSTSTSVTAVNNDMSITSTRLVGGSNNQHEPIKISVIYNKTE